MNDVLGRAFGFIQEPGPTEMSLRNEGFADLVLIILAGVVIIGAVWTWFRR